MVGPVFMVSMHVLLIKFQSGNFEQYQTRLLKYEVVKFKGIQSK